MKKTLLFLLLALFVFSCGADDPAVDPATTEDGKAFLDAVEGKKVTVATALEYSFSDDGQTVTQVALGDLGKYEFDSTKSATEGIYSRELLGIKTYAGVKLSEENTKMNFGLGASADSLTYTGELAFDK